MRCSQPVSISPVKTGRRYLVTNTRCACMRVDRAAAALHVQFRSRRCHGGKSRSPCPTRSLVWPSCRCPALRCFYGLDRRGRQGALHLPIAAVCRCAGVVAGGVGPVPVGVESVCGGLQGRAPAIGRATGVKVECGPAQLDKRLTRWRAEHEWLAAGSSVAAAADDPRFRARPRESAQGPQRQESCRARQRRGMPKFKSKHRAAPSLNYTLRGFVLDGPQLQAGRWDRGAAGVVA